MKILFISAVLPYPLHSGGQIRIYNLLKLLGEKHEITLCSFIRDASELRLVNKFGFCRYVYMIHRGYAWQLKYVMKSLFSFYPFLMSTYDNQGMRTLLDGLLRENTYDLLHIEPGYVWPSVPKTSIPLVVSEHNIEYRVYEQFYKQPRNLLFRPLFMADVHKLKNWEQTIWKKADRVTAVSDDDKSIMQPFVSKHITVVPNGVDITQFVFRKRKIAKHRVLFVGNFRWIANRDAANILVGDIWPIFTKRFPQAQLRLVGVDIPKSLKQRVLGLGGEVKEKVPDISREYRDSDILIAPHIIAGGTKYKILEAFASGLPVVTTKEGAKGLDAVPDIHYKEASGPADFVAKTREIWENITLADQITRNARTLVEETYTWEQIAKKLEDVWYEATH